MERATPVVAIDPDAEIRMLLDAAGGSSYGVQSEAATLGAGTVVVTRAAVGCRIAEKWPEAKVVAIGGPEHVLDCLRAGAYSYFSDPISATAFRDVLHNAMEARDWRDDLTLVSGSASWLTLRVRCKMQTLDRLSQWLREFERDLADKDRDDLITAFREMLTNAIEHGGQHDPNQTMRVSRIRMRRARAYHIKDPGPGFSLNDVPHAAIANADDNPLHHVDVRAERGIRPGGFGIMLSKNLADELLYNEIGNEVLLVKYVPEP